MTADFPCCSKFDLINIFYSELVHLLLQISLKTLKVLRTADFAPLVVFIAPTNTAAKVLNLHKQTI